MTIARTGFRHKNFRSITRGVPLFSGRRTARGSKRHCGPDSITRKCNAFGASIAIPAIGDGCTRECLAAAAWGP